MTNFRFERTIDCFLELLGEEIVLRFEEEKDGKKVLSYIPVHSRNIDHYFLSVPRTELGPLVAKHSKLPGI